MRKKSVAKQNSASGITCTAPWRLTKVVPLPHYQLEVVFNDGTCGRVDMTQLINSNHAGVFATLRDKDCFNKAHLEYGAVTWPGEIDLSPDAMYDAIKEHGCWILK